mgnify:FL=1|tara:strand:- start:295 stop:1539 length:1245 start_codon:yes stop_codon:yes gene_type:complete
MEENTIEEVVVDQKESTTTTEEKPVEEKVQVKKKRGRPSIKRQSTDDVIKIDLSKPKEQEEENVVEEKQPVAEESTTDEAVGEQNPESEPEQKSEEQVSEDEQSSVLSEVTEEEDVQEKTEELTEEVKEAVEEQKETGVELPENIQKVVDFMNETGGSLEDYVRLNQDYSSLDDKVLLSEYYKQTKPHLDNEEINFLMEDSFSYDEDVDEERDIKRKKLAFKEQVANAKIHLDGQKSKYYEEIKSGSKLAPEQQKAIDFFNRYNKETEESQKVAEKQKSVFLNKTNEVFNDQFKGFEYDVGDKKYRFNVKESGKVKETQSDINNFVKKFLNKDNEVEDARGYHKSLFTAMNSDAIAKHFYEQGKADAIKDSVTKSKNINMNSRQSHGEVESGGVKVRVLGDDSASFKFKLKNKK